MLGKLMKYEFKATSRVFLPIYGALIIVAVVNRIFTMLNFELPSNIGTAIAVIMMIGICVITLILTVQRFSKNLLSSEGYLMFTLPVKTDTLILSKLLVSSVWYIVSAIVVGVAILIMALTQISIKEVFDAINELFMYIRIENINIFTYIIEFIVVLVLQLFSGNLMLYACVSMSLLSNKHRGLISFGTFIAFSIIGQTIGGILTKLAVALNIEGIFKSMSVFNQIHSISAAWIVCSIITAVVFYALTKYMLKHRLNLE